AVVPRDRAAEETAEAYTANVDDDAHTALRGATERVCAIAARGEVHETTLHEPSRYDRARPAPELVVERRGVPAAPAAGRQVEHRHVARSDAPDVRRGAHDAGVGNGNGLVAAQRRVGAPAGGPGDVAEPYLRAGNRDVGGHGARECRGARERHER